MLARVHALVLSRLVTAAAHKNVLDPPGTAACCRPPHTRRRIRAQQPVRTRSCTATCCARATHTRAHLRVRAHPCAAFRRTLSTCTRSLARFRTCTLSYLGSTTRTRERVSARTRTHSAFPRARRVRAHTCRRAHIRLQLFSLLSARARPYAPKHTHLLQLSGALFALAHAHTCPRACISIQHFAVRASCARSRVSKHTRSCTVSRCARQLAPGSSSARTRTQAPRIILLVAHVCVRKHSRTLRVFSVSLCPLQLKSFLLLHTFVCNRKLLLWLT